MKSLFKIETNMGPTVVQGHVFPRLCPGLGLHCVEDGPKPVWRVTHLESGRRVLDITGNFQYAKEVCKRLASLADWRLSVEELKHVDGLTLKLLELQREQDERFAGSEGSEYCPVYKRKREIKVGEARTIEEASRYAEFMLANPGVYRIRFRDAAGRFCKPHESAVVEFYERMGGRK